MSIHARRILFWEPLGVNLHPFQARAKQRAAAIASWALGDGSANAAWPICWAMNQPCHGLHWLHGEIDYVWVIDSIQVDLLNLCHAKSPEISHVGEYIAGFSLRGVLVISISSSSRAYLNRLLCMFFSRMAKTTRQKALRWGVDQVLAMNNPERYRVMCLLVYAYIFIFISWMTSKLKVHDFIGGNHTGIRWSVGLSYP